MKYKIGIFGSAIREKDDIIEKAKALGNVLSLHDITLITGACSGLPYEVASITSKKGIEVLGYSPEMNLEKQKNFTPDDDLSIYQKIIYVPKKFEFSSDYQVCRKYRNVISIANCDAGIILGGRWGTMNEFTNLFDMGKIIGVLTGTGGIADELPNLCAKIKKGDKAKIIYNDKPEKLVELLIKKLKNEIQR